jgi:Fic family protein
MFKPKYRITEKLLSNIKHIAALVAELNGRRFPKTIIVALEKQARELSTFASTSIEGNPLPLTEVKRVLKNRPQNLRDTEREVINYNHALEELEALIRSGKADFDLMLILRIQKTVTNGLIAKSRCGNLRKEPVFVNDPRTGKPVYWPPDHRDVAKLMNDLIDLINGKRNAVDPLILAGIFHRQFVIIHPFMDGNGRTARLATKVLLASMGLNTFDLFSFENYYNRNVTKYFDKVGVHNTISRTGSISRAGLNISLTASLTNFCGSARNWERHNKPRKQRSNPTTSRSLSILKNMDILPTRIIQT